MNKEINSNNYEEYLIDYLDGSLSPELESLLFSFLEKHPEIQAEMEGLELFHLEANDVNYDFKEGLKKNIRETGAVSLENFEHYCIAFYEGDLNKKEEEHLQNFIKDHPSLEQSFKALAHVQLKTDKDIKFHRKEQLQQFASATNESINEDNYRDFIIAYHEGDLPEERQNELHVFLSKDTAYQHELEIFGQLKLKANPKEVFLNKSQLKRKSIVFTQRTRWTINIAASIILLFSFYFLLKPENRNYRVNASKRIAWQFDRRIHNTTKPTKSVQTPFDLPQSKPQITNQQIAKHLKAKLQVQESVIPVESLAGIEWPKEKELLIHEPKFPAHMLQIRKDQAIDPSEGLASNEKEIHLKGFSAKIVSRLTNLLNKGDHLKKERLKKQAFSIAEYALAGYNALTESKRNLNQNEKDKPIP